jgi:hypothetical protein
MLKAELRQIRTLQVRAKKEREAPPPDLLSGFKRAFGDKDAGVQALKELKSRRALAEEFNHALRSNNCATMDLEGELSRTD